MAQEARWLTAVLTRCLLAKDPADAAHEEIDWKKREEVSTAHPRCVVGTSAPLWCGSDDDRRAPRQETDSEDDEELEEKEETPAAVEEPVPLPADFEHANPPDATTPSLDTEAAKADALAAAQARRESHEAEVELQKQDAAASQPVAKQALGSSYIDEDGDGLINQKKEIESFAAGDVATGVQSTAAATVEEESAKEEAKQEEKWDAVADGVKRLTRSVGVESYNESFFHALEQIAADGRPLPRMGRCEAVSEVHLNLTSANYRNEDGTLLEGVEPPCEVGECVVMQLGRTPRHLEQPEAGAAMKPYLRHLLHSSVIGRLAPPVTSLSSMRGIRDAAHDIARLKKLPHEERMRLLNEMLPQQRTELEARMRQRGLSYCYDLLPLNRRATATVRVAKGAMQSAMVAIHQVEMSQAPAAEKSEAEEEALPTEPGLSFPEGASELEIEFEVVDWHEICAVEDYQYYVQYSQLVEPDLLKQHLIINGGNAMIDGRPEW